LNNNHVTRTRMLQLVLLLFALTLTGCGADISKGFKASLDWSRGVLLGENIKGPAGFAVDGSGERIHLVWPRQKATEDIIIRYMQLDQTGAPVLDQDLTLPSPRPRAPRLLLTDGEALHLFWTNRLPEGGQVELWHALLGPDGQLDSDARRLSSAEDNVESYSVAGASAGGAVAVWNDEDTGEVYALRLDAEGEIAAKSTLIAATGNSPSARVDHNGQVHLIWRDEIRLLYTSFSERDSGPTEAIPITRVNVDSGGYMLGPKLGLSDGWVYVFWSILGRSGLRAGMAYTQFVSFPLGNPGPSETKTVSIASVEASSYSEGPLSDSLVSGAHPQSVTYQYTQLANPASDQSQSDFIHQPDPAQGQRTELAVALAVKQQLRYDEDVQTAMALFEDGEYRGYQMAGKTLSISRQPGIAADDLGNLYVIWREGVSGEQLYFAATAPQIRAVADKMSVGDMINLGLRGGLEGLAAVMFLPLALPLLVPGLILLFIVLMITNREALGDTTSWVLMVIAFALYQGSKLVFLPDIVNYIPFSAWIDIPYGWTRILQIGVPILIALIAVLVAEIIRRRRTESIMIYYFALTLTDTILTLAVYGVLLLGVL